MTKASVPTLRQAVVVAQQVAAWNGLVNTTPEVLHAAGNVWVHLHPYPVVAQIPKDTISVRGQSAVAHLTRDVQVSTYLAGLGAPVGEPTDLIAPGPHEKDGFIVAFYKHYDKAPVKDDEAAGRALRVLHEGLATYKGSLAKMETPLHEPKRILGMLQAGRVLAPAQLHILRVRLELAGQYMNAWPMRPVHGDVHLQNVAWTTTGPRWTDMEDVCIAPLLWDFACLVASTQLYGIPVSRLENALRGYEVDLSADELKPFVHARVAQVTAWAATRAGHDPKAAKRLKDGLHFLRYHHL